MNFSIVINIQQAIDLFLIGDNNKNYNNREIFDEYSSLALLNNHYCLSITTNKYDNITNIIQNNIYSNDNNNNNNDIKSRIKSLLVRTTIAKNDLNILESYHGNKKIK